MASLGKVSSKTIRLIIAPMFFLAVAVAVTGLRHRNIIEISTFDLSLRQRATLGFGVSPYSSLQLKAPVTIKKFKPFELVSDRATAENERHLLVSLRTWPGITTDSDGKHIRRLVYGMREQYWIRHAENTPEIAARLWSEVTSNLKNDDVDAAVSLIVSELHKDDPPHQ